MIKGDLVALINKLIFSSPVLVLVFLPIIRKEELTGWHPSGVTTTRIRVLWVNFSEFSIKGNEI